MSEASAPVSSDLPPDVPGVRTTRDARGRFVPGTTAGAESRFGPGNVAALRTGVSSAQVRAGRLPDQADARAMLEEARAAIEADLGGPEAMSAVAKRVLARFIELDFLASHLWEDILRRGVMSPKGSQRAAVSAYLAVIDRQARHAQALGLERKARKVPSLTEVLG